MHHNKEYGKQASSVGGYIWHDIGSGKTLTSFKTAVLAKGLEYIDKVLFVVDRKDLDNQATLEYEKFQKKKKRGGGGVANSTFSTRALKGHLESSESKIIITVIQKLSRFIEDSAMQDREIFHKEVVFIFDERHRNQQGKMHKVIAKCFKKHYIFGFIGTPIMEENNHKVVYLATNGGLFGRRLHAYTICDAIRD